MVDDYLQLFGYAMIFWVTGYVGSIQFLVFKKGVEWSS